MRQFIQVNLLLPSVFGILWFSVFGGAALYFDDFHGGVMFDTYRGRGMAAMVYQLFSYLPGNQLLCFFFVIACFLSFITATDSNTDAIGRLCMKSVTAEHIASPFSNFCGHR